MASMGDELNQIKKVIACPSVEVRASEDLRDEYTKPINLHAISIKS